MDDKIIAKWINFAWSITICGQQMFSADFVFLSWSLSTSRLLGCFSNRVEEVLPKLFMSGYEGLHIIHTCLSTTCMHLMLLPLHYRKNPQGRSWMMSYCFSLSSLSLSSLFSPPSPCYKLVGREEGCVSCLNVQNHEYLSPNWNSYPNAGRRCWAQIPKAPE